MITANQSVWLDCRGGRTYEDVGEDEKGLYVFMGNGFGNYEKVYIPEDNKIKVVKLGGRLLARKYKNV